MSSSALGSDPDGRIPIDTVGSAPLDVNVLAALPPGPELDAAIDALLEHSADRASRLDDLCEKLYKLVAQHDPVQLVPSVATLASMGPIRLGTEDVLQDAFSLSAKVEYLAGLAVAGSSGRKSVNLQTVQAVASLVTDVFEAAQARLLIEATSDSNVRRVGIDQTRFLLRLEHLTDRMSGYASHLQEIADEVFEPNRDFYCEELGFCPSDAVRLVRRHTAWVRRQYRTRDDLPRTPTACLPSHAAAVEMHYLLASMEAGYIWTPDRLAETTNLPVEHVAALLRSMSTESGCQPEFRKPFFDENKLRRYPLVRMADDRYLVPVPWAVAHCLYDWIKDYIGKRPRLASKYREHRSQAAERLVHRGLERVFDKSAVFGNQHYDSTEGHGEIDSIVVGSTPILAEVKSHALHERVRLGHRLHTECLADDVVTKSFDQTRRASDYILREGGRSFADRQGSKPRRLLGDDVTNTVLIAVTLERMDPLAMASGELVVENQPARIWVTNVADFLMVRDILDDPASFLHYATIRGVVFERGIQIYLESDALGEYLKNRLTPLIDQASEANTYQPIFLGHRSVEINDYFTTLEEGVDVEKPGTGVPSPLSDALRTFAPDYPPAWVAIASAVMSAPRKTWRAWKHFLRRHKGERPFVIPGSAAAIVTSPTLTDPEIRSGDVPHLAISNPRERR